MFLYNSRQENLHWGADCSRALLAAAAAATLQNNTSNIDSNNLSNCNTGLFSPTNRTSPNTFLENLEKQRQNQLAQALFHMQQQQQRHQQQHHLQHLQPQQQHSNQQHQLNQIDPAPEDDDEEASLSDEVSNHNQNSNDPLQLESQHTRSDTSQQAADENEGRSSLSLRHNEDEKDDQRATEQETALNLSLRASRQVTHKTDSDDLDRIRNFIEQFKTRRGTLGLTQKQAAQCFRAYTNDRYAFSDNFVGHFEGFQFRPQTAMTIADSLAEWLEYAERETRAGRQLSFMPGRVKETRKRKYEVIRIRDSAKRVLVEAFEKNKSPSTSELEQLSRRTNIPSRNIEIFFKNRRTSRQYHQ